jgi:hypothetical protein
VEATADDGVEWAPVAGKVHRKIPQYEADEGEVRAT